MVLELPESGLKLAMPYSRLECEKGHQNCGIRECEREGGLGVIDEVGTAKAQLVL